MLRGLIHHWRINLAVAAGAAVATAVLAGAVVIGDSMEASLRRLTLDRLGDIDWSLVTEETFREALVEELASDPALSDHRLAPVLAAGASAVHVESRSLASEVSLYGIDARFTALFGEDGAPLASGLGRTPGQIFPSVVINASLAGEIDAEVGQDILLSFEQISEIPRESLLGNQPTGGSLAALRATVTEVIPDSGPGRFALASHQEQSLNAYVDLAVVQSRLDRSGRVNTILASGERGVTTDSALATALGRHVRLDDLGLEVVRRGSAVSVSNRRFVLRDTTTATVTEVARNQTVESQRILGYLANRMSIGDRTVPYSMLVGLALPAPTGLGALADRAGDPIDELSDDQIVLGAWAADELSARVGDAVEITYYEVGLDDELVTRSTTLEVAAVAAMSGLMTGRFLLPDFPGIADADDIAAWEPPFPMDLGLVRPQDEAFWDDYGPAPKAVVSLATAQRLWGNRFGDVTTIRMPESVDTARLEAEILAGLDLGVFGLAFDPVRVRGLQASAGATDFAGLFLAFSLFLIVAAGLVVGLLFALSVEMRSREVGLLRAVGYPLSRVRRMFLAEGMALAVVGCLVGVGLAILYAAVLIRVIVDLWADMLDLPLLTLHLDPLHIGAATVGALALVAVTIVLTVRRLRRVPIPALLAGASRIEAERRRGRWSRWTAVTAGLGGVAAIGAAQLTGSGSSAALFFIAGALFLTCGLALFSIWLRSSGGNSAPPGSARIWMAARNSSFNPGRSLLSVALVACASFMLVSIAANRRVLRPESLDRDSGTGGYSFVASTAVPVRGSLEDPETLSDLGLPESTRARLGSSGVVAMRVRPGDDASCLNLYQPETPRVVGVPADFVARGGFAFSSVLEPRDNPWTLLEEDFGDGVIPAIGDANSVTWILHSGLGKEIELVDDRGRTVRLLLVGLLTKSIFQSELVVSEEAFLRHFPHHGGHSYFLFESGDDDDLAATLESELGAYGFDATSTLDKLARFLGIEEMYLSTFQLLGGLGLILGTVGLGIVLVRNVNERRGELAMLRAVGFERASIAWLILLETAFQLACGLAIGTLSGFLALTPYVLDTSLHLPWTSLLATIVTVIGVGMLSAVLGVSTALRSPLLPALKAE